jgi:hypothetical protein
MNSKPGNNIYLDYSIKLMNYDKVNTSFYFNRNSNSN